MLRVNDCFALLKKVAAFVTVLLLRFFSPAGFGSSLNLRPKNPVGGDNFFVDTMLSSEGTAKVEEEEVGVSILLECGTESDLSLGGLVEEPLNILFSNPPWLELLRLFPASLKVGTESTGKKRKKKKVNKSKSKSIETSYRRGL